MKNQDIRTESSHQAGNALFIVLISIALLVGLTMMVTRLSSKSSDNISTEQAKLLGERIMRAAQTYETAVQKLVNANQCSENQLNFANTSTTIDYTNSAAPPDKRCDFFNAAGAGLVYEAPDESLLDPANSAKSDYGDWVLGSDQCILEVGTGVSSCTDKSESELILMMPHIRQDICLEINKLKSIPEYSGDAPTDDIEGAGFTGSFSSSSGEIGASASSADLIRKTTGCILDTSGAWNGSYVFYHVILAR